MASVIYVAGARPNFMKVAPILKAARGGPLDSVLVHTGQHYDYSMSGVFFEQLGIPAPNVHLEIGSATHGVQTGRIMAAFEQYVVGLSEPPRGIVVVGDVNSTMACALVGSKLRIPVAHVEAGLRSFDRTMPEEINRVVTDAVSEMLLVSEPSGMDNLSREGAAAARVHYVGNTMIDTLVDQLPAASELGMPARLGLEPAGYAVVTLHRPSNVDDHVRLAALIGLLERVARKLQVVFPVHPRTDVQLRAADLRDRLLKAGVRMLEPLGYREFIGLVAQAKVVVTDSGGIQEETTYLGVPCVTLRTTTERPVTVDLGTNVLVGEDLGVAARVIEDRLREEPGTRTPIDGWDGRAAHRIVNAISALVA
jgi:UDP-N-acetylglucosamine 2-epimerase (non-hydrolysing)